MILQVIEKQDVLQSSIHYPFTVATFKLILRKLYRVSAQLGKKFCALKQVIKKGVHVLRCMQPVSVRDSFHLSAPLTATGSHPGLWPSNFITALSGCQTRWSNRLDSFTQPTIMCLLPSLTYTCVQYVYHYHDCFLWFIVGLIPVAYFVYIFCIFVLWNISVLFHYYFLFTFYAYFCSFDLCATILCKYGNCSGWCLGLVCASWPITADWAFRIGTTKTKTEVSDRGWTEVLLQWTVSEI